MSTTVLTITLLSRVLAPLFKDLYTGAKGQAKQSLDKLSTVTGTRKLATTLMRIEKVKTIWSTEDDVSLKKFYYPSMLDIDDNNEAIHSIYNLPDGNLVVEGIVGQGKSIFMRYLACSLLNSEKITKIPALLELRNISSKRNLPTIIDSFLKTSGISGGDETFSYLASSGKLVLLLDGFDEIPEECVTDTIVELDTIQTKYPELKIIVSSRPQSSIQNLVGFRVIKLVPLTDEDYDPFVKKLIPSTVKRTEVVDALLACPEHIKGIISTPLMLTLVIVVYQTEKEIPLSLADFFDKLFGIVFTKHDKLKAGFNRQHYSGLPERRLRQLFDAFCFMAVQTGGGRSLTRRQFNFAFDNALKYVPECKCDIELFRKDITKVACLLIEEGLDLTTFLHKSILDYHAAAFVRELPDVRADAFYKAAAEKYRRWQQVLSFLNVIDRSRHSSMYYLKTMETPYSELVNAIEGIDDSKLLSYIITTHGNPILGVLSDHLVSWGPANTSKNELDGRLFSNLLNGVMETLLAAHNSQIMEAFAISGSNMDSDSKVMHIPLKTILETLNLDKVRENLKTLEQEIRDNIVDARAAISAEHNKESAFEDILETASVKAAPPRKRSKAQVSK